MKVSDKTLNLVNSHYKADYTFRSNEMAEAKAWELSKYKDINDWQSNSKGRLDFGVRLDIKFRKKAFYCLYL